MPAAPEVAVREALAAYLRATLSLATNVVESDWFPPAQALPHPVAISVHEAGEVSRSADASTALVASTPGSGAAATMLYRTGEVIVPIAVDVWCETQAERDAWTQRVADALQRPPSVDGAPVADMMDGLTLTCAAGNGASGYFGAVVTYDTDTRQAPSSPEGSQREEWRAVFQVTARVDLLREVTTTREVSLVVTPATGPRVDPTGTGGADADITVFPAGT